MTKQRLGKGLQALITDMAPQVANDEVQSIAVDSILPNPYQPRRVFQDEQLQELADSIRHHGLIQPVTVRPRGDCFELIVGERRLRAAKIAGLREIPAFVRDMTDLESMEVAVIENLQREDLNPMEEAAAFHHLQDRLGYTQDRLAQRLGKSRPYVANTLRLLTLPTSVAELVSRGTLSAGHARAVLSAPEHLRETVARRIVDHELTVREAEQLATSMPNVSRETKTKKGLATLPLEFREVESRLRDALQTRVALKRSGNKGTIEITYHNSEELERLLELLTGVGR